MKKIKWLRKLPVFVLALILAISPLLLVSPAQANVLDDRVGSYVELPDSVIYLPGLFPLSASSNYIYSETPTGVGYVIYALSGVLIFDGTFCSSSDGSLVYRFNFSSNYVSSVESSTKLVLPYSAICCGSSVTLIDIPYEVYVSDVVTSHGVGIFSVFTGVASWLSGAVSSAVSIFWTSDGGLTVLGYLAVLSLALAVILLLLYLIAGWLRFR